MAYLYLKDFGILEFSENEKMKKMTDDIESLMIKVELLTNQVNAINQVKEPAEITDGKRVLNNRADDLDSDIATNKANITANANTISTVNGEVDTNTAGIATMNG